MKIPLWKQVIVAFTIFMLSFGSTALVMVPRAHANWIFDWEVFADSFLDELLNQLKALLLDALHVLVIKRINKMINKQLKRAGAYVNNLREYVGDRAKQAGLNYVSWYINNCTNAYVPPEIVFSLEESSYQPSCPEVKDYNKEAYVYYKGLYKTLSSGILVDDTSSDPRTAAVPQACLDMIRGRLSKMTAGELKQVEKNCPPDIAFGIAQAEKDFKYDQPLQEALNTTNNPLQQWMFLNGEKQKVELAARNRIELSLTSDGLAPVIDSNGNTVATKAELQAVVAGNVKQAFELVPNSTNVFSQFLAKTLATFVTDFLRGQVMAADAALKDSNWP